MFLMKIDSIMEELTLDDQLEAHSLLQAMTMTLQLMNMVRKLSLYWVFLFIICLLRDSLPLIDIVTAGLWIVVLLLKCIL